MIHTEVACRGDGLWIPEGESSKMLQKVDAVFDRLYNFLSQNYNQGGKLYLQIETNSYLKPSKYKCVSLD